MAADLDGTLLDSRGKLSPRTLAVARRLRDAGVVLAPATSRRWAGAAPVARALDLTGPLILYDGAQIVSYPDGAILATDALAAETARRAAAVIATWGLQPIAQFSDAAGERLVVGTSTPESPPEPGWAGRYLATFAAQVSHAPLAALAAEGLDPVRVVAFGPLALLRRAAVELAVLGCGRQLLLAGSYGTAELAVFSRTASKGAALLTLARRLGIPRAETLAIGDGSNDLSMLRSAGLGIAMANAPRRVRAAAGACTVSNDEDGAAFALERYLLAPDAAGEDTAGEV